MRTKQRRPRSVLCSVNRRKYGSAVADAPGRHHRRFPLDRHLTPAALPSPSFRRWCTCGDGRRAACAATSGRRRGLLTRYSRALMVGAIRPPPVYQLGGGVPKGGRRRTPTGSYSPRPSMSTVRLSAACDGRSPERGMLYGWPVTRPSPRTAAVPVEHAAKVAGPLHGAVETICASSTRSAFPLMISRWSAALIAARRSISLWVTCTFSTSKPCNLTRNSDTM